METITTACASAVASAAQGSFWLGIGGGVVAALIVGYLRDRLVMSRSVLTLPKGQRDLFGMNPPSPRSGTGFRDGEARPLSSTATRRVGAQPVAPVVVWKRLYGR